MSFSQLINVVSPDGLRALVHDKILYPAEGVIAKSSLTGTIPLEGGAYEKKDNQYELRISKSYLKHLIRDAKAKYQPSTCRRISELYRTGLGLPHSKECHLLWLALSNGYAAKVAGRVYSYRDMVRVLLAHWEYVNKQSADPYWFYLEAYEEYYRNLLREVYPHQMDKTYIKRKPPVYVFPKYLGLDCSLVYKRDGEAYRLHAAFLKVRDRMLNYTVQALRSKSIPTVLPEGSVPSNFNAYFTVSGTLTIRTSGVRHLHKYWGKLDLYQLIKASLEQDTYALGDVAVHDLPANHPSREFVANYRSKYRKAQRFVQDAGNRRKTRNLIVTISKAKKLIDRFEEHQQVVNSVKEERKKLEDYEVLDNLEFIALDMYGYTNESRELNHLVTSYDKVHGFLKGLGLTVSPYIQTRSKSVNKIYDEVATKALRGFKHNGILYRTFENGDQVRDKIFWVKTKLV